MSVTKLEFVLEENNKTPTEDPDTETALHGSGINNIYWPIGSVGIALVSVMDPN